MDEMQEKIGQIQMIQQNIQNSSLQRQQLQVQESEIESALKELGGTDIAYKIIGSIMVKTDNATLKKDLEEKQQMLTIRIKSIEKQESRLREKAEELQKEVMQVLEKKDDDKQSKVAGKHK